MIQDGRFEPREGYLRTDGESLTSQDFNPWREDVLEALNHPVMVTLRKATDSTKEGILSYLGGELNNSEVESLSVSQNYTYNVTLDDSGKTLIVNTHFHSAHLVLPDNPPDNFKLTVQKTSPNNQVTISASMTIDQRASVTLFNESKMEFEVAGNEYTATPYSEAGGLPDSDVSDLRALTGAWQLPIFGPMDQPFAIGLGALSSAVKEQIIFTDPLQQVSSNQVGSYTHTLGNNFLAINRTPNPNDVEVYLEAQADMAGYSQGGKSQVVGVDHNGNITHPLVAFPTNNSIRVTIIGSPQFVSADGSGTSTAIAAAWRVKIAIPIYQPLQYSL